MLSAMCMSLSPSSSSSYHTPQLPLPPPTTTEPADAMPPMDDLNATECDLSFKFDIEQVNFSPTSQNLLSSFFPCQTTTTTSYAPDSAAALSRDVSKDKVDSNVEICQKCMNHKPVPAISRIVTLQISFDEAIKLCVNPQCPNYLVPVNQSSLDPNSFVIKRDLASCSTGENSVDISDEVLRNARNSAELAIKVDQILDGNKLVADLEKVLGKFSELPQPPVPMPALAAAPFIAAPVPSELPKEAAPPLDELTFADFDNYFLNVDHNLAPPNQPPIVSAGGADSADTNSYDLFNSTAIDSFSDSVQPQYASSLASELMQPPPIADNRQQSYAFDDTFFNDISNLLADETLLASATSNEQQTQPQVEVHNFTGIQLDQTVSVSGPLPHPPTTSSITITRLDRKPEAAAPSSAVLNSAMNNAARPVQRAPDVVKDLKKRSRPTGSAKDDDDDDDDSLLPWEKPKKKTRVIVSQPPPVAAASTSKLVKTPMDAVITKASLSNKKNEPLPVASTSLKQTGAELKKAIMQDSSLLLKSMSKDAKPAGGYKDLVLSVLKKKPTTTA